MSSTTRNITHTAAAFTEHTLQVDGLQMRYLEAGQGDPVVVLCSPEELTQSPFFTLLAQQRRVIAFEFPGSRRSPAEGGPAARDAARRFAHALVMAGLDHYVLLGVAVSAPAALWQALDARGHVDALVLISPSVLPSTGQAATNGVASEPALTSRLGEIQAETLVLFGTEDTSMPPETGRLYVEQMPNCYYVLVYDAGQALLVERPEALHTAVCDFVQRRGAFIVEHHSTAINP